MDAESALTETILKSADSPTDEYLSQGGGSQELSGTLFGNCCMHMHGRVGIQGALAAQIPAAKILASIRAGLY